MKKLSPSRLADTVVRLRKQKSMTQAQLGEATGINRALISRIEQQDLVMAVTVYQKTPSNFLPTTMMFHKI